MSYKIFKYNIGDMFIIPGVKKIGIIIDRVEHGVYTIFWQYDNSTTEITDYGETDITNWISYGGGPYKNTYLQAPK